MADLTVFFEAVMVEGVQSHIYSSNIYPDHMFTWKMQGVNCATEDYTLGNTSEIAFTFETDLQVEVGAMVYVKGYDTGEDNPYISPSYGRFMFQVTDVVKKKTLQNRYDVTCTSVYVVSESNKGSLDSVIEKSDLSSLPANYTLMDLATFAARGHVSFNQTVLVNTTYVPSTNWWYQGLTYRQLYQWCCQLMGVNDASTLWLDTWQDITFTGLFAPTTPSNCCIHFDSNNTKSIDMANYQTPVIDKIWFGNESTDVGFSLGTGDQAMMFPSNPLINPTDTTFLNPIYNKVHALQSYTPMKIETFQAIKQADTPSGQPNEPKYRLNGRLFSLSELEELGTFNIDGVVDCYMWPEKIYSPVWFDDPRSPEFIMNRDEWNIDWLLPNIEDSSRVDNPIMYDIRHIEEYIKKSEPGATIILCRGEDLTVDGPEGYGPNHQFWTDKYCRNQMILLDYDDNGFTVTHPKDWAGRITRRYYTYNEFCEEWEQEALTGNHPGIYNYIWNIMFPRAGGYKIKAVTPLNPDRVSSTYHTEVTLPENTNFYLFPGDLPHTQLNQIITLPAGTKIWSAEKEDIPTALEDYWLIPEGSNWKGGWFVYDYDMGHEIDSSVINLFYLDGDSPIAQPSPDFFFHLSTLAWNWLNNDETYTWMSYTDDMDNTYYCPIFSWEASPSGIILQGTGNKDRRIENSYLSYDLRTTGKYVDINSAISGTEGEISGVTTTVSALNVRVGNVEAAVNNKVDVTDYNGNTIISKINALGVTQTINSNRVDLSGYVQSSSLATVATSGSYSDLTNTPDGDDIITEINAATTTINNSRIGMYIFEDSDSYTTTAADTYEYSGISFEVPADKVFTVEISSSEDTEIPTGIVLSDSDSIISFIKEAVTASMPNATGLSMTFVGHPNSNTTYYIWAKTASTGTVGISYTGWYM